MIYTHSHLPAQTAKPISNALSQLLTLTLMVGIMVGGVALVVGGVAWVVAHVDDLLSFQTFKVFFIVNMLVWAFLLGGLAYNIHSKKRVIYPVEIANS